MHGFHIFTVSLVKHVPDNLFPASKKLFFYCRLETSENSLLGNGSPTSQRLIEATAKNYIIEAYVKCIAGGI
jgi:hypothetical protein